MGMLGTFFYCSYSVMTRSADCSLDILSASFIREIDLAPPRPLNSMSFVDRGDFIPSVYLPGSFVMLPVSSSVMADPGGRQGVPPSRGMRARRVTAWPFFWFTQITLI